MKNNHEITLKQYAAYCKEQPLYLGTAGSYGMEMLTIIREGVWAEYDILAAFHPPVGAAVQVRVGANNQIGVPIEATAEKGMGEIVFAGYKEGVRQIAVDVLYKVAPSSGASGTEPAEPTPDVVQQILSAASNAEKLAQSVRDDADKIKESLDEIPKIDDTAITTTSPWSSKQIVDTLCPPIEETGNPVVCYPVAGYPLDVTVSWGPTQEGSGTPSPENIRPIKGRDSVTITRQEDNQVITLTLPETVYGGEVDAVTGEGNNNTKVITLDGNELKFSQANIYFNLPFHSAPGVVKNGVVGCSHFNSRLFGANENYEFCFLSKSDMDGLFANVDELNTYCAAQYAAGTPVQICYKLKEPVPFTAAGAQPIPALSGTNTLLTDADSVSVSGRADLIHIIRKMQEK
ncbi:hypothetical protein [Hominenteromicrobium sp.]|uniref:hypothetical protein n=1 Tax=Hominenteromicrobium sp. TaxID=3073581 RepID=UPI003A92BACD